MATRLYRPKTSLLQAIGLTHLLAASPDLLAISPMLTCSITAPTWGITVSYLHHHRFYSGHHPPLLAPSPLASGRIRGTWPPPKRHGGRFCGHRGADRRADGARTAPAEDPLLLPASPLLLPASPLLLPASPLGGHRWSSRSKYHHQWGRRKADAQLVVIP